ncbi:MAG TPA: hypothetical protein VJN68_01615 [Burkholderiaceae bacterium]|nr:hypothetical protein [Burkholderiaceae bacterium]
MIDRIFSAALTFCLLVAGTLAIGSALFGQDTRTARAPRPVIELPTVTVVGQRTAMAIDVGAPKLAAGGQDAVDCTVANAVAPAPAAEPAAPAHI